MIARWAASGASLLKPPTRCLGPERIRGNFAGFKLETAVPDMRETAFRKAWKRGGPHLQQIKCVVGGSCRLLVRIEPEPLPGGVKNAFWKLKKCLGPGSSGQGPGQNRTRKARSGWPATAAHAVSTVNLVSLTQKSLVRIEPEP
ncbi:hypothetical protein C8R45DRAFT_926081 [Mycena sanguinolenta]|nr:hypothetical protein C8R45DRAFT_926081 [Mycena sanguinolenta]